MINGTQPGSSGSSEIISSKRKRIMMRGNDENSTIDDVE
jgi:hypothetical protein